MEQKPKVPRGRNGGPKVTVNATERITVTLDAATIAVLRSINPDNLSAAIRELARQSKD